MNSLPVEEKFGQIFPARNKAKLSEWCESGHSLMLVAGFRHGTPTHRCLRGIPAWRGTHLSAIRHGDLVRRCLRGIPA